MRCDANQRLQPLLRDFEHIDVRLLQPGGFVGAQTSQRSRATSSAVYSIPMPFFDSRLFVRFAFDFVTAAKGTVLDRARSAWPRAVGAEFPRGLCKSAPIGTSYRLPHQRTEPLHSSKPRMSHSKPSSPAPETTTEWTAKEAAAWLKLRDDDLFRKLLVHFYLSAAPGSK